MGMLHKLDLAEPFATFNDALRSYLERAGVTPLPPIAAIAVAGPVAAGTARFTNRGWDISEQSLRQAGFERALLINDFAALALAVDLLDEEHLHPIGRPLKGLEAGTITILGAGTGFGVSCLARYGDRLTVPMATEGGHMGFAPGDAEELAALQLMWKQSGRVSIERGGVYIAGGIAEKIEEFLIHSPFRRRFEDEGRLTPYVAAIPTNLIVYPDIALLGAARSGVVLAPAASK
jgi:glucokinase